MSQPAFEVVGGKELGSKAYALKEHLSLLQEVGLTIPDTLVVAGETVRANDDVEAAPNIETLNALDSARVKFKGHTALVVRSSAEGDSTGNGVYESHFAANDQIAVEEAAHKVIESFKSPGANDFRRQRRVGEIFAVMVQPVIGEDLESTERWENFGPYLSGLGYSSTRLEPSGFIKIVAGIGGGVTGSGGQIITGSDLRGIAGQAPIFKHRQSDGAPLSFHDFLAAQEEAIRCHNRDDVRNNFRSGDDMFAEPFIEGNEAIAGYLTRQRGDIQYTHQPNGLLNYFDDGPGLAEVTREFVPEQLLEALTELERRAGYPVYVEWALSNGPAGLQPIILQIASAEQTQRSQLDAELHGKTIASARNLVGHGIKEVKRIVVVSTHDDIDHLRSYNRNPDNEGYLLIFSSDVAANNNVNAMRYADCSKAAGLIEIQADDFLHRHVGGDIATHFFGAARDTDKFVGEVTSFSGSIQDLWQRVHNEGVSWKNGQDDDYGQIYVLDGNFALYADETVGHLTVTEG